MDNDDFPRGEGDADFYPIPAEEEYKVQLIDKERALVELKIRQQRTEFFMSEEFKQAEQERIESVTPKEHEVISFGRVYCPIYGKVRPQWLCEQQHGDYHEIVDKEEL